MKFSESKSAHKYLDGLKGLEIGGSAHNPFGLDTKNVDYTASADTVYKNYETQLCGETLPVDIVAHGDNIPVQDESYDFVINSHVLEHFPDPIKALVEWYRIIRPGGYIFMIIPHKERTFDKNKERTTLQDLIHRHESGEYPPAPSDGHYSIWITEDMVELIKYLGWKIIEVHDVDDKSGNGFMIIIQKINNKDISNADVAIIKPSFFQKIALKARNLIRRSLRMAARYHKLIFLKYFSK